MYERIIAFRVFLLLIIFSFDITSMVNNGPIFRILTTKESFRILKGLSKMIGFRLSIDIWGMRDNLLNINIILVAYTIEEAILPSVFISFLLLIKIGRDNSKHIIIDGVSVKYSLATNEENLKNTREELMRNINNSIPFITLDVLFSYIILIFSNMFLEGRVLSSL